MCQCDALDGDAHGHLALCEAHGGEDMLEGYVDDLVVLSQVLLLLRRCLVLVVASAAAAVAGCGAVRNADGRVCSCAAKQEVALLAGVLRHVVAEGGRGERAALFILGWGHECDVQVLERGGDGAEAHLVALAVIVGPVDTGAPSAHFLQQRLVEKEAVVVVVIALNDFIDAAPDGERVVEEQVVAGNLAEGCARGELFLVGGGTARVYAHEGQGHTVDVHAPGVVALHGMSAEGVGDDGGAVQCGFAGGGTCAAVVVNHVGLFHDAYAEGDAVGIVHLAGS